VKYSPVGSKVNVVVGFEHDQTVIAVQDHGIGIPETDQPHLFEMFHRGSNVGGISGTGLGLAIVKQVATVHGGTIDFQTQPNRGTTFTLALPA
jgi:signal transduction histidine kinase